MMVREGLELYLGLEKFMRQRESGKEASPFHGRENLRFFHLDNGEIALVRAYHHGGILRHLTGEFFFTWPPRPFRELAITEEVRRRGIPTLEIFGAWVERAWGPFYRGWLVTREIKGAHDLWAALQSDLYVETSGKSLLQAVAQGLRRMHRQGVYHRDLNLKNVLVRREEDGIISYIIDFDKARLFPREVPSEKAQKNLSRLLQSVCKLDPDRRRLSHEDWDLFIRFYKEAGEG
ncbi:MAG: lipopolysaccharide kinase InaA family protein [Candidatus Binatia bacterium]